MEAAVCPFTVVLSFCHSFEKYMYSETGTITEVPSAIDALSSTTPKFISVLVHAV